MKKIQALKIIQKSTKALAFGQAVISLSYGEKLSEERRIPYTASIACVCKKVFRLLSSIIVHKFQNMDKAVVFSLADCKTQPTGNSFHWSVPKFNQNLRINQLEPMPASAQSRRSGSPLNDLKH